MPRPREFEPEDVVAGAMELFWRKGFQGTSLRDLVDETGVNRASLYSVFRDKHALFLQALAHYRHAVVPNRIGILERPGGGVAAIREYFEAVSEDLLGPARGRGCLMVNSAIELAANDAEVALEVRRHLERLEGAFAYALSEAVELGEVEEAGRVPALARYLTGVSQGLMVVGKAVPDADVLRDIRGEALAALL